MYRIPLHANDYTNSTCYQIALQFPDELLHDSVPIFRAIKRRLDEGRELYVLADTSYGRQATIPQKRLLS